MAHLYANCGVKFSTKFRRMETFHFMGAGESEENGHYFPFSSDVELYLRSLTKPPFTLTKVTHPPLC